MTVKRYKIAVGCVLFLMLPCSLWPQQKIGDPEIRQSPQIFMQNFYNWYVPKALSDNAGPAWNIALKYRKHVFSPELFRALKEDSDVQAKASDPVGLDFDPFLNSQDPCEHYEVGSSAQKGNEYQVKVYAICSGKRAEVPAVIVELVYNDRQWQFVNFLYPNQTKQYSDSGDLLGNLKILSDDRRKHHGSKLKTAN